MSSVVRLQVGTGGIGTGFVVFCDRTVCLVMTAYHVIREALLTNEQVRVIFPGGHPRFEADVDRFYPTADLALLRFDCHGQMFNPMRFAELAINSAPQLFLSPVYLRGYNISPYGEIISPGCFTGMITGMFTLQGTDIHYLRGSYPCEPGNSGGPVTMEGRVVGVNLSADAAESVAISVMGVHTALVFWTNGRANTIDEMLQLVAE